MKKSYSLYRNLFVVIAISTMIWSTGCSGDKSVVIDGGEIGLEFDNNLHSRVISKIDGDYLILGDFNPAEFIVAGDEKIQDFNLVSQSETSVEDKIGKGKQYVITGISDGLQKTIIITSYDDFPALLLTQVEYTNTGNEALSVDSWTNNNYNIKSIPRTDNKALFWSFQPGSYGWSHYWVQPIEAGFELENYMGMTNEDYGGGTPVADIWRQDAGLAVGHVEMLPRLVSLPVSMKTDTAASMAVTYKKSNLLEPGENLLTFQTFVSVHKGDNFNTLSEYRRFMVRQGIEFKDAPDAAFETIWCGWGYEKDFTVEEFYGSFPMVKKLGIDWIVLDYGWENGVGNYYLPQDKFQDGKIDMHKIVNDIHDMGKKAKLWWMPLSVYPGTDMHMNHPDYLLLNEDGSTVDINFWKSYFLCPASEEVQKITRDFVIKALRDWGWDGLKIDGNNLNAVPPCYNPSHNHAYPEESFEALPGFYKMIYETALSINPEAVIEICPCGTNQSFYIMPYMNQTVSSDPRDSWHVRQKGKTIKALTGDKTAFYGDHVELSDDKSDFASTVGIGGVIGTKFVWPPGVHMNEESGDVSLIPEKEAKWAKWIKIYNDKMLSRGHYRGELYDIGYDRPEAHAIQKGDEMYYAFYADKYEGELELRGLEDRIYRIKDYVNNIDFGTVRGTQAMLKVSFEEYLLIEVIPE